MHAEHGSLGGDFWKLKSTSLPQLPYKHLNHLEATGATCLITKNCCHWDDINSTQDFQ